MKERELETAKKFAIVGNVEKLQKELLQIDGVVDIDFDLDGFYDNMHQVIVLVKYDIPATLEKYFEVRRELKNNVIKVAKENGLSKTEDRIEDYGTWFYFVFKHDKTWNTVKIIKTTDYFNKSIEELSELRNDGTWTREECLICDDGLVVHWFNSLETLSKNINTKTEKCNGYDLELKAVLELQAPNTNNNKYAMVFC